MRTLIAVVGLVAASLFLLSHPGYAEPMFMGLGNIPGGGFFSAVLDVSADGSTAVGVGAGTSGDEAFRWTSGGGMVGLGSLYGTYRSHALGVSADGSVVVGYGIPDRPKRA
jgi:hypothetical protein